MHNWLKVMKVFDREVEGWLECHENPIRFETILVIIRSIWPDTCQDPVAAFASGVESIHCTGSPKSEEKVWIANEVGALVELADGEAKRLAAVAVAGVFLWDKDIRTKVQAFASLFDALVVGDSVSEEQGSQVTQFIMKVCA